MKDPNASRRKKLATQEMNRMCARYIYECHEIGTRQETEEEKLERLKKRAAEEKYKNRYQLQL